MLHGPLFRAEKPRRWPAAVCLRPTAVGQIPNESAGQRHNPPTQHVYATELVNAGVSLETIHRRLGHANAQTVQRYAEQTDVTADAEIRSWRRAAITGLSAR